MDERSVGLNCVNSTMRQPPNWREADEDWAVAEGLIGTIRRECVRPCRRIGRAAFAPSPKIECALLQHGENAEHDCRMLVSVRKHFESFESLVIQSGDLIREGHHRCGRRRTADVT